MLTEEKKSLVKKVSKYKLGCLNISIFNVHNNLLNYTNIESVQN